MNISFKPQLPNLEEIIIALIFTLIIVFLISL